MTERKTQPKKQRKKEFGKQEEQTERKTERHSERTKQRQNCRTKEVIAWTKTETKTGFAGPDYGKACPESHYYSRVFLDCWKVFLMAGKCGLYIQFFFDASPPKPEDLDHTTPNLRSSC